MNSAAAGESSLEEVAQYETVFTNAKAGMEGVDKQKVKQVIYDLSKNSAHFKNEQRKQGQIVSRIVQMKEQLSRSSLAEQEQCQLLADQILESCQLDFERIWIHVDMDAFFASVEERDQPHLKQLPMAVGGMGMICTANYIARKFGVRSAMPGFIAKKLCPELVFVSPNFEKYTAVSAETREIFRIYDPHFEAPSLDEAYLDITQYCKQNNTTSEQVSVEVRESVFGQTGVTCSVGVACNCMLAKICSDLNKPNGQYVLASDYQTVTAFMHQLPTRKVPNIGKVTEQLLREVLGISTCGELLNQGGNVLMIFTQATAAFFLTAARGIGRTQHEEASHEGQKGMSVERTFRPIKEAQDLEMKARELCSTLSQELQSNKLIGRTVTVKFKLSTFQVHTRSHTMQKYVNQAEEIFQVAWKLIKAELPIEIRLMGVRVSGFQHTDKGQLTLHQFFKYQSLKDQKNRYKLNAANSEQIQNAASNSEDLCQEKENVRLNNCSKNQHSFDQQENGIIQEDIQNANATFKGQLGIKQLLEINRNKNVQIIDNDIEILDQFDLENNQGKSNQPKLLAATDSNEIIQQKQLKSNTKINQTCQSCLEEQNLFQNAYYSKFFYNMDNSRLVPCNQKTNPKPNSDRFPSPEIEGSSLVTSVIYDAQSANLQVNCDTYAKQQQLCFQDYLQQQQIKQNSVWQGDKFIKPSLLWRCRFCTFSENKTNQAKCEICEMARAVKRQRCGSNTILDYFGQNCT